jgi:nucleoside-diphosphate-sugar epimerase
MIIGNGMIANALKSIDSEDICFFASGVSTSSINNKEEFNRERKLLLDSLDKYSNSKIIIYFSSCGVDFEETPYFEHKLNMERIVSKEAKEFYIFRLPQVVGRGGNIKTLFNHLIYQAKYNQSIEIWENVRRNLIDVDHIVDIIDEIIIKKNSLNTIINIASPYNVSILELVNAIELVLNRKINYTLSHKGKAIDVNINFLSSLINLDLIFKNQEDYLSNLIRKYEKDII